MVSDTSAQKAKAAVSLSSWLSYPARSAQTVGHTVLHHGAQGLVEALLVVASLDRLDDVQQVRVRAGQALAKDDQTACQSVGALHSDGDRHAHVAAGHEVGRAVADASASQHVHAVVHSPAHPVSQLLLHDSAEHSRLLVLIEHGVNERLP
eukprot:15135-Heterococcus_DN1.PRE.4